MTDPLPSPLAIVADRDDPRPISEQIRAAIRQAILDGRLPPGARLPSGRDLSAQLGVARGTVQAAFDRLIDEGLLFSAGAAGTRVAAREAPAARVPADRGGASTFKRPLDAFVPAFSSKPLPFQMGVPADDAFPAKVWARLRAKAVRHDAMAPTAYADPRGEPDLRAQIARQLAISRKLQCAPDQVIVTSGYRQGLSLVLLALDAHGGTAWMEEPGFPLARRALELAGLSVAPIPVDVEGLRVRDGIGRAPDAVLALVTPGQQAPLGVALSERRRHELLSWAATAKAWILEDDYLSELQLDGRAAPALASGDGMHRVVHLGSFSKTLSPSLGLGFVVPPASLVDRFAEVAAVLNPAPNRTTQLAIGQFMAEGHYLRHLRRMKTLYRIRRDLVREHLASIGISPIMGGLTMLLRLPGIDDVALAARAWDKGIAPAPLSVWYAAERPTGLMLNVANMHAGNIDAASDTLHALLKETR